MDVSITHTTYSDVLIVISCEDYFLQIISSSRTLQMMDAIQHILHSNDVSDNELRLRKTLLRKTLFAYLVHVLTILTHKFFT